MLFHATKIMTNMYWCWWLYFKSFQKSATSWCLLYHFNFMPIYQTTVDLPPFCFPISLTTKSSVSQFFVIHMKSEEVWQFTQQKQTFQRLSSYFLCCFDILRIYQYHNKRLILVFHGDDTSILVWFFCLSKKRSETFRVYTEWNTPPYCYVAEIYFLVSY